MLLEDKMLEKFYFETFLIVFSAFVGALISSLFTWTINKSGLDKTRKIVFLISMFVITLILVAVILGFVIYFIGFSRM